MKNVYLLITIVVFVISANSKLYAQIPDVGVIKFISPSETSCYTDSEKVIVRVHNFSNININFSIDTLEVRSNCNYIDFPEVIINNGTLAPGASIDVIVSDSFNMSSSGIYHFVALTNMLRDTNRNNDLSNTDFYSWVSLPQSVNFEGFSGDSLTNLFPYWREAEGYQQPAFTESMWKSRMNIGTLNNYSAVVSMDNTLNRSLHEWIVGPKFFPLIHTSLNFDISLTGYNTLAASQMSDSTKFNVMITEDCGQSWQAILTFTKNNVIGNTFTTKHIDLTSYMGEQIAIAFYVTDTNTLAASYDLHIDNIMLTTPIQYDAGVVKIITPDDTTGITSDYPVKIRFKNFGAATLTSVPLTYQIGSYPAVNETWTGTLASMDSIEYTFNQTLDSIFVDYALCCFTQVAMDELASNDSKCMIIKGIFDPANIEEESLLFVNAYPLPASSYITLSIYASSKEKSKIKIIDIAGNLINEKDCDLQSGLNNIIINTNDYSEGFYFYSIQSKQNIASGKFCIAH